VRSDGQQQHPQELEQPQLQPLEHPQLLLLMLFPQPLLPLQQQSRRMMITIIQRQLLPYIFCVSPHIDYLLYTMPKCCEGLQRKMKGECKL